MKSYVTLLACTIGSGQEKKLAKGACAPSDLAINPQSSGDPQDARHGRIASCLPLDAHADRLDVSAADRRASGQALADSPDPAADTSSDAEVMSMLLDGQMPHHRLEAELGDAMRATGLRRTYVDSWESAVLTARGVGTSIPDPAGGLRAVGLSFIGLSSLVLGMLPSKPALCDLSNAICCCCCSPPRRYP